MSIQEITEKLQKLFPKCTIESVSFIQGSTNRISFTVCRDGGIWFPPFELIHVTLINNDTKENYAHCLVYLDKLKKYNLEYIRWDS